jgi:hypothetical protein
MKLAPKLCPCGCSNVILDPVCGCQCSSVRPEVAQEMMVKVNTHADLMFVLDKLMRFPDSGEATELARKTFVRVAAELKAQPTFEPFPWAKK